MSRQSLFGYCLLCHGFTSKGFAMPLRHTRSLTLASLSSMSALQRGSHTQPCSGSCSCVARQPIGIPKLSIPMLLRAMGSFDYNDCANNDKTIVIKLL
jgi:hypothetical protein